MWHTNSFILIILPSYSWEAKTVIENKIRLIAQPYDHTLEIFEQHVHACTLSTCALQNLHNTSSPVRLHQPPQSAPAHMLAVQDRIWIYAVPKHCAGRAALSELQQKEIEDEKQANQ